MKRIAVYICILALLLLAPVERADVGKLLPVEGVSVDKTGGTVILTVDTGERGTGANAEEALADLKKTTAALVYLDTARYLLVTEAARTELGQLRQVLKGSVRVCLWDGEGELSEAVRYLSVHGNLPKLRQVETGSELPFFTNRKISQKNEK